MKTPKTTEEMIEEWDELIKVSTKLELRQWLQSTLTQLASSIHEQSALEAEGRKTIIEDLMNKIDTLVGYLEVPELPEQTVRLGIIEEWEDYKREAK